MPSTRPTRTAKVRPANAAKPTPRNRKVVAAKKVATRVHARTQPATAALTGTSATKKTAPAESVAAKAKQNLSAKRAPAAAPAKQGKSAPKRAGQRGMPAPSRVAPDAKSIAHALHGLLHTMHTIQQHEESLCSLAHALEHGRSGAATLRELQRTLEQLPAHDYLHEVEALRDAAEA